MDCPCNSVTITALSVYDTPMDFDRLRQAVEQRLLCFPRFRQRVREPKLPLGLPVWEVDRQFRLEHHLHHVVLPPPGDWAALQSFLDVLNEEPLHPDRPLWDMYLVDGYGAGSAMVMRLSHAVADGAALMHVMDTFCPASAEESLAPHEAPEAEAPSRARRGLMRDLEKTLGRLDAAVKTSRQALRVGFEVARHPGETARLGTRGALALGKLLLLPPDSQTMLRGECGPAKHLVASRPVPLADLKAVAKALDCKINDLLLTAISGALRRYLLAHEQPVQGLNIRAMVPVYLGQWDKAEEMRNGFGLTIPACRWAFMTRCGACGR
jgi:WS/DGAT/MGAT family acyltransferase